MRVYEEEKEEIITKKLVKASCDFCGEDFDITSVECKGFGNLKINFGYGSRFDGSEFRGEVCDDCFAKLFKNKIRQTRSIC